MLRRTRETRRKTSHERTERRLRRTGKAVEYRTRWRCGIARRVAEEAADLTSQFARRTPVPPAPDVRPVRRLDGNGHPPVARETREASSREREETVREFPAWSRHRAAQLRIR